MVRAAWSVAPVWALALAAMLAIALTGARTHFLLWIPVACGATILIALGLQLLTRSAEGLVERLTAAIAGSLAVFAIGTLVLWIVS